MVVAEPTLAVVVVERLDDVAALVEVAAEAVEFEQSPYHQALVGNVAEQHLQKFVAVQH